MSPSSFSVFTEEYHTSLSPAEIERELSSMWKPIHEAAESENQSVSRVVLGNLIWLGTRERLDRVLSTVRYIVPKYPCRMFLLVLDPEKFGEKVDASVNAQCFLAHEGGPSVCCEVIRMTFGPNGARHVRGCVAPLLLPDIQTVLWDNLADHCLTDLESLPSFADRVIHQGALGTDTKGALERILRSSTPSVDLCWFRMAPLRDQVASVFDDPAAPFDLHSIQDIKISTFQTKNGDHVADLMAALFIGWIGSCLGWKPGKDTGLGHEFVSPNGPVYTQIQSSCALDCCGANHLNQIEMRDAKGENFRTVLAQKGCSMDIQCLGKKADEEVGRHLMLSELSEGEALGNALNHPLGGQLFSEAARLAKVLF